MLKRLIQNSPDIILEKYDWTDLLEFKESLLGYNPASKVIVSHRGIPDVKPENVFWVIPKGNQECSFLYLKSPEHDEEYLYFMDDQFKRDIIEAIGNDGDEYYYGIDFADKKYCIELKYTTYKEIYINFITTLPKGCSNKYCSRLNGLFKVLKIFLDSIGYIGRVALKDDVQVNGKSITLERILEGKGSIYEKYGFFIDEGIFREIKNSIDKGDKQSLKVLSRNIPMVAENTGKFDQC